jgi:hypothetical protein
MIPVNTRYKTLFEHAPLGIKIREKRKVNREEGKEEEGEILERALEVFPQPVQRDEDTLVFVKEIPGAYALWHEDISGINRLHREIEESVAKLKAANDMLSQEEKIKRVLYTENERTKLFEQLEREIALHTNKLKTMIDELDSASDKPKAMARIILLLAYIKRRCNLFFREREADTLPSIELVVYMNEIAEIAGFANIRLKVLNELEDNISVRRITLFYDFLYRLIYWTTWQEGQSLIASIGPIREENGGTILQILTSEEIYSFQMDGNLEAAIRAEGGYYSIKDLGDGDMAIMLCFRDGEARDD